MQIVAVLLRVVDGQWPFPSNYQLAPQPLAALDLLDYPSTTARQVGREFLRGLKDVAPATVGRRTARARVTAIPCVKRLLGAGGREPRPRLEGDPGTDTAIAAAHMVGVLWVSQNQGASVKKLRAAIGITRERLEAAYDYLLKQPSDRAGVQPDGDELRLASAGGVAASVERQWNAPRPPLCEAPSGGWEEW